MKILWLYVLICSFALNEGEIYLPSDLRQEDNKSAALRVLSTKCNTCHATKKRTDIFTLENMDTLALDIWKQVFVKKKMPKGRKAKLTEEESKALRDWLDITLAGYN